MNELLQKHGCSNVFTIPDGLRELMSDISREVLREQPSKICDFITNYLSALLVTREHGILAMKILEDLCDCKPTVSEHLMQLGFEKGEAEGLAEIIKGEIEGAEPTEGKEKVRETELLKKVLRKCPLDEEMTVQVCQVARNAYRDYWYRKKLLAQGLKMQPDEPWEIAAQNTLELYKKTKPSFTELSRATQKIQAAYRGYYVRKNMLKHLSPKPKKVGPRVELSGPPVDAAASREIELGPVIDIKANVREDDVNQMFEEHVGETLGLKYDPMKTITHQEDNPELEQEQRQSSRMIQPKGAKYSASTTSHVSGIEPEVKISFIPEKIFPNEDRIPSEIKTLKVSQISQSQILQAKSAISQGLPSQSQTMQAKSAMSQQIKETSQIQPAHSKIGRDDDEEPFEVDVLPAGVKSVTSQKSRITNPDDFDDIQEDQEIQEIPIEVIQEPPIPEVPEDIFDELTASAPSTAPVSGATTDAEEAGEIEEEE